jgi:formylglycine-generating enzyme required for sulfatase activity
MSLQRNRSRHAIRAVSGALSVLTLLWLAGCGHDSTGADPDVVEGYNSIGLIPAMIAVPRGTFKMGWDYLADTSVVAPYPPTVSAGPSGPVRIVTLTNDYQIGKYEITNAEYCAMLNYALWKGYLAGDYRNNVTVENAQGDAQELLNLDADYEGKPCEIYFNGTVFVVRPGLEQRPVVYVSWYGAAFYCNILGEWQGLGQLYNLTDWSCTFAGITRFYGVTGYRIPTEAEWEHAARYDANTMVYDRRAVPWESSSLIYATASNYGRNLAYFAPYANYMTDSGTADVGSYEAGKSLLGIYDLTGNVSEWAQDFYASYSFFAPYDSASSTNPVNDQSRVYRQRRGGSWLKYANNFPLTTYHTDTNWPYTSYCDFGFRIVKVL